MATVALEMCHVRRQMASVAADVLILILNVQTEAFL